MKNSALVFSLAASLFLAGSGQAQNTGERPGELNVVLVAANAGRDVTLLQGDSFTTLAQFPTHFPDISQLLISPDGSQAYALSRRGWLEQYDLPARQMMGRLRVGPAASDMVISEDGKWLAMLSGMAKELVIVSTGDLTVGAVIAPKSGDNTASGISALLNNPQRQSFVIALSDAPKIWEIFYGASAPEMGFAHDWRVEGPVRSKTGFPVRKFTTGAPLESFAFDASYEYILATTINGDALVIDLVIGMKQAELELAGGPDFDMGVIWNRGGADIMAAPHPTEAVISVIDLNTWQVLRRIPVKGVAQVLRSHENSSYLWVGRFAGPDKGTLEIINKKTLEIAQVLRLDTGAELMDVVFSKGGSRVLVSLRKGARAVIVYDAKSLRKLTSLPVSNPVAIAVQD